METTETGAEISKYLFLGVLYLLTLFLFWVMWRQAKVPAAAVAPESAPAQPRQPAARRVGVLLIEGGPLAGKRMALKQNLTIGRSAENDVVLADHFASARHATLRTEGGHTWLVDEGSTNGTFVNGFRISAPCALKPGDTFVIGGTTFRLIQG